MAEIDYGFNEDFRAVLITSEDTSISWDHCSFEKCQFEGSFNGLTLTDCTFRECDFSNAAFEYSSWFRCLAEASKATGCSLDYARLKQVEFNECQGQYLHCFKGNLEKTVFKRCSLNGSGFRALVKNGVTFSECDIDGMDLEETDLKGIDVSSSFFGTLRFHPDKLGGFMINAVQAEQLIRSFNVIVKE